MLYYYTRKQSPFFYTKKQVSLFTLITGLQANFKNNMILVIKGEVFYLKITMKEGSNLCLTHINFIYHILYMSRPLRIEYPGAYYHVMNRGRHKDKIFLHDNDYLYFISLLQVSTKLFRVGIVAYCLLSNHYHLLIHTPEGNLSRCMRHIGSVYTQWFNRKYSSDGQLFRGRYKSILIDEEKYLLSLVRYIHHNPLKAGVIETPEGHLWNSHHGYVSDSAKWNWLYKEPIYAYFHSDPHIRIREYLQYLTQKDTEEIDRVYSQKKLPAILGSESFIKTIKQRYTDEKTHNEVPESKLLMPSARLIIDVVCTEYGIDEDHLLQSRRGITNEPRNVAVYLIRHLRGENLNSLAMMFQISKYSTASSICTRLEERFKEDSELKIRITRLKEIISQKSQAKI
jgi:REP element-mobilizing transposase RayT